MHGLWAQGLAIDFGKNNPVPLSAIEYSRNVEVSPKKQSLIEMERQKEQLPCYVIEFFCMKVSTILRTGSN